MLQLIYDRTAQDLKAAEELLALPWRKMSEGQRAAYAEGLRGLYDPRDRNRVESAVEYLSRSFRQLATELEDYAVEAGADWSASDLPYNPDDFQLETKTDWGPTDMFDMFSRARYISNIRVLRDAFAPDMPLPNSLDGLAWQGANDIEAALMAVEAAYERIRKEYMEIIENEANSLAIRSGEVFAGEVTA